ncbi:predicted protein [Uncinocarpus reesii 1704]|uniref:Uncharacterized protein n=1 Tax=Uncinocarpus reesii (strain UAMH 1704) TaxID=336963 RepID=C4JV40_UNCRE|nr:uncharacterized protein UREG_06432 [Uncinocarpus reesii 1704]EEP81567.1 predicted protein [Uncinocarpus reesii 1704]
MAYFPHNLHRGGYPYCHPERPYPQVDEIPWGFYFDIPLQLPSQPVPSFNADHPVFQIWSPPAMYKYPSSNEYQNAVVPHSEPDPYSFPQASSEARYGYSSQNAYSRNTAVSQPIERHPSRPSHFPNGISSPSPSPPPPPRHAPGWDNGYGFEFGIDESVSGYTGSYPQDCDGVIAPCFKVGSADCGWYRFELQYFRDGSQLRVTRVDDEDERENRKYKQFPPFVQKWLQGTTRFSFAEIKELAHDIIEKRKRYILGVSDCHNFAIDLVHKIFNSYKLVPAAMKLGTSAVRQLVRPVCLAITKALEWTGVIREPLEKAFRRLYPHDRVEDHNVNIQGQSHHGQDYNDQDYHDRDYHDRDYHDRDYHDRDYHDKHHDDQNYGDQYSRDWNSLCQKSSARGYDNRNYRDEYHSDRNYHSQSHSTHSYDSQNYRGQYSGDHNYHSGSYPAHNCDNQDYHDQYSRDQYHYDRDRYDRNSCGHYS